MSAQAENIPEQQNFSDGGKENLERVPYLNTEHFLIRYFDSAGNETFLFSTSFHRCLFVWG